MRIATWNVNGIRARGEQVHAWIKAETPEVICLQEIKASPAQVPAPLRELEDYWGYWHGTRGYSGVALLVRKDLSTEFPTFVHPEFDFEDRIVAARVKDVAIASVYLPNGGKDFPAKLQFMADLAEFANGFHSHDDALVICGDLNIARAEIDVHPKERRACIGQLPQEREWFEDLLQKGLVDLGRHHDPENESLFTWWAPWRQMRDRNIGWRLDYILASEALAAKSTACTVQREVGTSDHGPVTATFAL